MARETHLPVLFQLFRRYGYDGVSLAQIAAKTELGKASLYHHFPGGKAEMVTAALAYDELWVEENVFLPLQAEEPVLVRFQQMCDHFNELYDSGQAPCLLAALTTGAKRDIFHEQVKGHLQRLLKAISQVLIASGLEPLAARQRAEDAVVAIQGSLILARGLGDAAVFERAIARIPEALCAGLDAKS